jgi:Na+/melibiose symporter-like transporter
MTTLWVLDIVGFLPNVEQSDSVKLAIRSLYSLAPLTCYVIGTILLARFSLDETEHARIRKVLDERAAQTTD